MECIIEVFNLLKRTHVTLINFVISTLPTDIFDWITSIECSHIIAILYLSVAISILSSSLPWLAITAAGLDYVRNLELAYYGREGAAPQRGSSVQPGVIDFLLVTQLSYLHSID